MSVAVFASDVSQPRLCSCGSLQFCGRFVDGRRRRSQSTDAYHRCFSFFLLYVIFDYSTIFTRGAMEIEAPVGRVRHIPSGCSKDGATRFKAKKGPIQMEGWFVNHPRL